MVVSINAKEHAENHIRNTRRALHVQREKMSADIGELQRQLRKIDEQIADCEAAARVFDIDMVERPESGGAQHDPSEERKPDIAARAGARSQIMHRVGAGKSLKATATAVLESVYPQSLTKREIHRILTEELHLKPTVESVGTLLYRCSADRTVKHVGFQWFFVPEAERHALSGHEDPGALPPGINATR